MRSNKRRESQNDKVLFISDIPSPYNMAYLNELGKQMPVTSVFESEISKGRDSSWKKRDVTFFKCIILKGITIKTDFKLSFGVFKYIRETRGGTIIVGNPATPTGIAAILYCKLHRIPYVLQSEGGIPKNGKGLKEKIKYFLMHSAEYYLSGMGPKNDYFLTYGATKDRLHHYPFASLYQKDLPTKVLSDNEKKELRETLGIRANHMILYVGQFIHRKGVDVLLKACQNLDESVYILLIGGTPTEEYRSIIREYNLKNVHFMSFALKDQLLKYYAAADIFVLPTREDTWGLVVNEAMAYGLPVITTKNCVAGMELIQDGENGFLVEVEDSEALFDRMQALISNPSLCHAMGERNFEKMQDYTFENMARTIGSVIKKANGE